MRVLLMMSNLDVGGAESAAVELVRSLAGRGWEFTVAALSAEGGLHDAFARAGAEVIAPIAHRRFDLRAVFRIAGIVRSRRIEAVVVVDALRNGLFYGLIGSVLSGGRVARVCWCHASPGLQIDEYATRLRAYRAMGLLDAVVCVSEYLRGELLARSLDSRGVCVVHNGIDTSRFESAEPAELHLPAAKRLIVQVANVQPWKDHRTLLESAAQLARIRSDFHLLLVGRGTDSPEMARQVEELSLKDFVTLAGTRRDVPCILAAADVCVLSTHVETFGVAVVEGMSAGLPVVASDVPALREVFTHDSEGLKVPPRDPDALAEALGKLLDDSALRARLGESARRRARHFTAARMAERFARLLDVLTTGGNPADIMEV